MVSNLHSSWLSSSKFKVWLDSICTRGRTPTIGAYAGSRDRFDVHKTTVPRPTRLTPQQMDKRRAKGLCFNCDNKYSEGHKCSEKKLFYIDYEEEEDQELEPSQDLDLKETTPTISFHALVNISTLQTLKI
jgi:hypothetical protein